MKNTFRYGSYSYDYYIEFGNRKSLTLVVRPDLRIIVRTPYGTTIEEVESFLVRKWKWLEKQLAELRKYRKTHREKQYVSGESFYYLGRQYMLLVQPAKMDVVKLDRGKLLLNTTKNIRNGVHNKRLLEEWYDARRNLIFKREYLSALNLFDYKMMPRLRVRAMSRRWGSYMKNGTVLLNPGLIVAPREAIFYVCVHELCHVNNHKHNESFYENLNKRVPNWREIKESLEVRYG
jgi:predicted metal-dependent hydrolase